MVVLAAGVTRTVGGLRPPPADSGFRASSADRPRAQKTDEDDHDDHEQRDQCEPNLHDSPVASASLAMATRRSASTRA